MFNIFLHFSSLYVIIMSLMVSSLCYYHLTYGFITVRYYHLTYVCFQSESTLHSYLNVKELLAQNRRDIWNLSDSNGIWTQKHLVPKRTPNHLAKRTITLSVLLRISLLSLKTLISKSYSAKFLLKEGGIFKIVVSNRYRHKNVE